MLEAVLEDGSRLHGESEIARSTRRIRRVLLSPRAAAPTPGVVEAILDADLVVLGPGSLYTSIVPNLVVEEVGEALRKTRAPVILVANLVTEKGESAGLSLADHLAVIEEHAGGRIVDAVVVHEGASTRRRWPATGRRSVSARLVRRRVSPRRAGLQAAPAGTGPQAAARFRPDRRGPRRSLARACRWSGGESRGMTDLARYARPSRRRKETFV